MPNLCHLNFNDPELIDLDMLTCLLRETLNQQNKSLPSKLCRVGKNPERQYPKYLDGITLSHSIFIVQMEKENRVFIIDHEQELGRGAYGKVLGVKGEIILPAEESEQVTIDFHETGQFALKISEQRERKSHSNFTSQFQKEARYNKKYFDKKELFMGHSSYAKFSTNTHNQAKGRFLMPFLHAVPKSTFNQISSERLRQYKKLEFAIDFLKGNYSPL